MSKIARVKKRPVESAAQRERMTRTLALRVQHLCEDAQQRALFRCEKPADLTKLTCVGRCRKDGHPESFHALVLDERLCKGCRTDVALHLVSIRLRELARTP